MSWTLWTKIDGEVVNGCPIGDTGAVLDGCPEDALREFFQKRHGPGEIQDCDGVSGDHGLRCHACGYCFAVDAWLKAIRVTGGYGEPSPSRAMGDGGPHGMEITCLVPQGYGLDALKMVVRRVPNDSGVSPWEVVA